MYTIVDRYDNERETWSKSSPIKEPAMLANGPHDTILSAIMRNIGYKTKGSQ